MIELHAMLLLQSAHQFEAFAILAGEADRINRADAETDQIVEDRSSSARLAADTHNVIHRQAGFDGRFGFGGIDFEIAVEAKIAQDSDAKGRVTIGQRVKSGRIHNSTLQSMEQVMEEGDIVALDVMHGAAHA